MLSGDSGDVVVVRDEASSALGASGASLDVGWARRPLMAAYVAMKLVWSGRVRLFANQPHAPLVFVVDIGNKFIMAYAQPLALCAPATGSDGRGGGGPCFSRPLHRNIFR